MGLMDEEGQLDPIAVSSCIFLENETSEKQLESLLGRINLLKHRLIRLRQMVTKHCPEEIN